LFQSDIYAVARSDCENPWNLDQGTSRSGRKESKEESEGERKEEGMRQKRNDRR
jgi:hypothetical protein